MPVLAVLYVVYIDTDSVAIRPEICVETLLLLSTGVELCFCKLKH